MGQDEKQNTQFLIQNSKNLLEEKFQLFCLDERGKNFNSELFAQLLLQSYSLGFHGQGFILGTAYGLPKELAQEHLSGKGHKLVPVSFSPMTLSHELALVFLLEQIYRAQCIINNHPYHHGAPSAFSTSFGS